MSPHLSPHLGLVAHPETNTRPIPHLVMPIIGLLFTLRFTPQLITYLRTQLMGPMVGKRDPQCRR